MKTRNRFLLNLSPLWRTVISFTMAIAIFIPLYLQRQNVLLSVVLSWIGFSVVFLFLSWIIIFNRPVSAIKKKANEDDGSVAFVFFMIIASSFASMFAVLLLTISKDKDVQNHILLIPSAVISMISAWILVHTQYVFHYAHEYYDEPDEDEKETKGGLKFPGDGDDDEDDEPDYLDFAYFSFCMGSTYQVSDVSVTSKLIRKIVMVHGLLSFFMNTFVVALTINIVAGMNG